MPVMLRLLLFDRQLCYYYNNEALDGSKMAATRELHPAILSFKQVLSYVS
jgi:hypothetical protein